MQLKSFGIRITTPLLVLVLKMFRKLLDEGRAGENALCPITCTKREDGRAWSSIG